MKTFTVALSLPLQEKNTNDFKKNLRQIIVPQWAIGCGHITFADIVNFTEV